MKTKLRMIAAVVVSIIAMMMSPVAVAWSPQHITAVGVGPSSNLTITANITVAEIDTWKMGNFYVVVALQDGEIFTIGTKGEWTVYDAKKTIPAAVENVHLWNQMVQVMSAPVDLSALAGAYVYAGYGVGQNDADAQNDMLINGKFALVYGICPPTQFWGDTSCVTPDTTRVWLPALGVWAYPPDVEVTSPNKLPAGCVADVSNPCFRDTVKWIMTPQVPVGAEPASNAVPVVGAYFTNALGHDQLMLFHVDTGAVWGGSNINESGDSLKMTAVRGSPLGFKQAFEDGRRAEFRWFTPTSQLGVSSNIWQNVQL